MSTPFREAAPPEPTTEPEPPPNFRSKGPHPYLGILGLVLLSFGACTTHAVSSDVGAIMGWLSAFAIVAFSVVAYRRSSIRSRGWKVLLHSVLAFFGVMWSSFFWIFSSESGGFVPFGGWGRPLRVRGRAVTPGVRASTEWARGPRPDPSGLDDETRAVLAELWLHDARKEHASVPAFGRVARQLVALGAPSDLVRRAHLSCLQEIDHAERCFALASAYAGRDLGVCEMPALLEGDEGLPRRRGEALKRVAVEALLDGALLEDFNAELARTALDDVRDPAAREALERIVHDEAEHAALAWDILAFCVAEGGEPIARALEAAFANVRRDPESLYDPALSARVAALPDKSTLFAHGRVRDACVLPVYRARRAYAASRLAALLSVPDAARAA